MDMTEPGYVYILTNPSFRKDWVKIGKSSRPVNIRSKELDNTAVPLPFDIYATIKTVKYNEVEKAVHDIIDELTDLRIRPNREFFNIAPQKALDILKKIAQTIDDAVITEYANNQPLCSNHFISKSCQKTKENERTDNRGGRDCTKYSLNGAGIYGKGKLALEIVRVYIQNHRVAYNELANLLPKGLIKTVEEVNRWKLEANDTHKDRRWFEKDILTSADGINFVVSTQHCKGNINKIFKIADKFGLAIKELK
ncbi:MAG: GIY-YIG nuclease family protein [Bacteroides sp.]|nr:GIY-YIG nuclease family protein [Roseburia sp.]MCM1345857.1 GIY-YIG nuclease family protein [Bacteroides sp.]MCM1420247.1 GIY-YIG nuclease family protein [Bacteroides sp.]